MNWHFPANGTDRRSKRSGSQARRTICFSNGADALMLADGFPVFPLNTTCLTNTGRLLDEIANFEVLPETLRVLHNEPLIGQLIASSGWVATIVKPQQLPKPSADFANVFGATFLRRFLVFGPSSALSGWRRWARENRLVEDPANPLKPLPDDDDSMLSFDVHRRPGQSFIVRAENDR